MKRNKNLHFIAPYMFLCGAGDIQEVKVNWTAGR